VADDIALVPATRTACSEFRRKTLSRGKQPRGVGPDRPVKIAHQTPFSVLSTPMQALGFVGHESRRAGIAVCAGRPLDGSCQPRSRIMFLTRDGPTVAARASAAAGPWTERIALVHPVARAKGAVLRGTATHRSSAWKGGGFPGGPPRPIRTSDRITREPLDSAKTQAQQCWRLAVAAAMGHGRTACRRGGRRRLHPHSRRSRHLRPQAEFRTGCPNWPLANGRTYSAAR